MQKGLAKSEKICYNNIVQCQIVKRGNTSRGVSGALNMKPAVAGVDSSFEEGTFTNGVPLSVLRNGSCAIGNREPCQVGNQAALSGPADVPQGHLF